tara:strand:+ start:690 stop:1085 length:396 start_codon:yes stop_codon:yes gene_type:complete
MKKQLARPQKPSVSQALYKLVETIEWSVTNDQDISTIQWNDPDVTKPTDSVIQAKLDEMNTEYDLAMCRHQRALGGEAVQYNDDGDAIGWQDTGEDGYPPIGEQLDYIYHNGVDAWKTNMIDPVKARFPKP